jgi:hypothetical protein
MVYLATLPLAQQQTRKDMAGCSHGLSETQPYNLKGSGNTVLPSTAPQHTQHNKMSFNKSQSKSYTQGIHLWISHNKIIDKA